MLKSRKRREKKLILKYEKQPIKNYYSINHSGNDLFNLCAGVLDS